MWGAERPDTSSDAALAAELDVATVGLGAARVHAGCIRVQRGRSSGHVPPRPSTDVTCIVTVRQPAR